MDERRVNARLPLLLRVDYQGEGEFLHDYTENLSKGGVFIVTDRRVSVGDEIDLTLSFPGLIEPLEVRGTVCWLREGTFDQRRRGIGIDLGGDQAAVRALGELVDKVRAGDPDTVDSERRSYRVLIADRDEQVRFMFRAGLEAAAERGRPGKVTFGFDEVGDATDVIQLLEKTRFDLVVLDVNLLGEASVDIIRKVRADERFAQTPVLAIGTGKDDAMAAAREAGATLCLTKPLQIGPFFETALALFSDVAAG